MASTFRGRVFLGAVFASGFFKVANKFRVGVIYDAPGVGSCNIAYSRCYGVYKVTHKFSKILEFRDEIENVRWDWPKKLKFLIRSYNF